MLGALLQSGTKARVSFVMGIHHCRRIGGTYTIFLSYLAEQGKPVSLPARGKINRKADIGGAGIGIARKRTLPCNRQSYPLFFQILAHFFARNENSTLFFSSVSALFGKNRGWVSLSGIFPSSPLRGTNQGSIRKILTSLPSYFLTSDSLTSLLPYFAPVQSLRLHPGEK